MKIPRSAINEFKAIYSRKYGEILSDAEAEEQAVEWLNLYSLSQNKNIFYE
jgi:hypothetical protein